MLLRITIYFSNLIVWSQNYLNAGFGKHWCFELVGLINYFLFLFTLFLRNWDEVCLGSTRASATLAPSNGSSDVVRSKDFIPCAHEEILVRVGKSSTEEWEKGDRTSTAMPVQQLSHSVFWSTETQRHLKHLRRSNVHSLNQKKSLTRFEMNQEEKVIKKCHPDIGIVVKLSIFNFITFFSRFFQIFSDINFDLDKQRHIKSFSSTKKSCRKLGTIWK